MPVPEGMNSTPPQNEEEPKDSSPQEELFFIPLRGPMHDDPIVTAVQQGTRVGRRNLRAQEFVDSTQWIDDMIVPKLEKIMARIRRFLEDK